MSGDEEIAVKRRRPRHNSWWYIAWAVTILSVLLAIFVHPGLLGIAGFIGAAVVARYMFVTNRPWLITPPPD